MNVVDISKGILKDGALEVLNDLRKQVESGEIVCFVAVGIKQNDGTVMWIGNPGKAKTALQILGAIENLKLDFRDGL